MKHFAGWLVLLTAGYALAQPSNALSGATAQAVWNGEKAATIHITNLSKNNITAFTLTIRATFADGTIDTSELLTDLLPNMVNDRVQTGNDSSDKGLLHPNEAMDTSIGLGSTPSSPIVRVTAELETIAFDDGTAQVKNSDSFMHLVARRQKELTDMQNTIRIVEKVLSTPSDHPISDAVTELKNQHPSSIETRAAIQHIQALTSIDINHTNSNLLSSYVSMRKREAAIWANHVQLRRAPRRWRL